MNINTRSMRSLAVASSLVILGVAAWSGAAVADPPSSSIHVQLTDLDLATTDGRQAANDRLHQAARRVCARVADAEDLGRTTHVAACIERTMAKASASLQQLVMRAQTISVAQTPGS